MSLSEVTEETLEQRAEQERLDAERFRAGAEAPQEETPVTSFKQAMRETTTDQVMTIGYIEGMGVVEVKHHQMNLVVRKSDVIEINLLNTIVVIIT